jgi:transposase
MVSRMSDSERAKSVRRGRRSFTPEFRDGAVRMVLDQGKKITQVARDLGIPQSSLSKWVNQARADRSQGATGLTTVEREELKRLRRENHELKLEREILKKATAFFAKESK